MDLLGYQPVAGQNAELMNRAFWGDAIIRMWIRLRIRHEFAGRGSGNKLNNQTHEDILNSNEQMGKFAHVLFPGCSGKRIADNFEAMVAYMYDNGYAYEYLLEAYYQDYMLSQPRHQKAWAGAEMRCPLMNKLRKENRL
jgi:hypothetical protein